MFDAQLVECFVFPQEEEFADTGYQIAPSDPGAAGTALPTGVQQLGALTAEDFNRKAGALKDDVRCVVLTRMMLPGRFGALHLLCICSLYAVYPTFS